MPGKRFQLPPARYRHSKQSRPPGQAYVSVFLFEWEELPALRVTLARLAMVLVLLSIGNTPALRVITLQAGKPLLYESLLFKQEDLCFTSNITLRDGRILPWQSCGKPSTKFPHGGLVECIFIQNISYCFLFENLKFSYFSSFYRKFPYFRNGKRTVNRQPGFRAADS